ncbi:MAG: hypothetical protein J3K34DRAFT_516176 [Monoraphidium minutum]|nr:MAG: hypothetical protein J3K34DRAFT_516176 [Monoraphidium minutum]
MASSRGARGLGMSKADLEASRLVFVYLAQSKPKRKVAIPVPDSYSWEQFIDQVKARLRLTGVRDIYLASTGTKVRGVRELQDIDELCVVEGPTDEVYGVQINVAGNDVLGSAEIEPQGSQNLGASLRQQGRAPSAVLERHRSGVPNGAGAFARSGSGGGDREDDKYARRAHPLKRTLQRILPALFPAASLPLTLTEAASMDGNSSGGGGKVHKRRRGKRSLFTAQNVLAAMALMSCFGTMIFFYTRVSKSGPGVLQAPMAGPGSDLGFAEIKERYLRPYYLQGAFLLGSLTLGLRTGAMNYVFVEDPVGYLGTAAVTGLLCTALAWILFDFTDTPGGGNNFNAPK